jgi:DNA-binding phage protein
MRKYQKWREIVIEQLAADWDAALEYIQFAMEEYQVDGDTAVFLLSLRTFIESQGGVAELSKKTGVDREVLSKMLSSEEAPRLDMLVTILTALGCKLSIKLLGAEGFRGEKEDVDAVLATSEGIKPDIVFARDNK